MKKRLLLGFFTLLASASFAQFTAGNLAIYRYGNGTNSLTNGGRVPVFVDEYTPAGVLVNTIPISRTADGANYGLEGLGLTSGGAFEKEGYPVLSRDGSTLSIIGHNPAVAGQFVIGTINATGNVNTETLVVDAIGAPRSAVVEGTSVYFNGYDGGVRYKSLGTATASTRVSTGQNSPRVLTITDLVYNNGATTSQRIFSPIGSSDNAANATPLPTASTNFGTVNYPGGSTGVKPQHAHQMVFINAGTGINRRTLLYLLDANDDDNSPMIKKYRLNGSATDWLALDSVAVPVNTTSLTAKLDGSGVKLYFTTYGDGASVASGIYTMSDNFTDQGNTNITATSYSLVVAAPANTTFRGVTMAPGTNVLPVALTSFKAKETGGSIRLNWSTASEKNSLRFDILRSFDGKDFQKIGEVVAIGNSDVANAYSFNDENPFPGANYYKLQQVDKDGKSSFYGPVSVNAKIEKTDFSVYASSAKAVAEINVYSSVKQQVEIRIVNIGGQVLVERSSTLEKGFNKISLPVSGAKTGVQIVMLNTPSGTITKKFLWQ